jgi:hypothetical protein
LEDQGVEVTGRMGSECILRRLAGGSVSGSCWLRIWALVNTGMNLRVLAPRNYLVKEIIAVCPEKDTEPINTRHNITDF